MVVVASYTTLSVAANSKSTDQISGTYQYGGKGTLNVFAKSSATGLNMTLSVGGVPLINDQPIPFFGATGSLDKLSNYITGAKLNGQARIELTFRNTTGGALTVDYLVELV